MKPNERSLINTHWHITDTCVCFERFGSVRSHSVSHIWHIVDITNKIIIINALHIHILIWQEKNNTTFSSLFAVPNKLKFYVSHEQKLQLNGQRSWSVAYNLGRTDSSLLPSRSRWSQCSSTTRKLLSYDIEIELSTTGHRQGNFGFNYCNCS